MFRIASIGAFFARPLVKYIAVGALALGLVIGALLIVRAIYSKGETAGKAAVTNAVQKKTIETQADSVKRKDKVDNDVSKMPYKDKLDALD